MKENENFPSLLIKNDNYIKFKIVYPRLIINKLPFTFLCALLTVRFDWWIDFWCFLNPPFSLYMLISFLIQYQTVDQITLELYCL